MPLTDTQTYVSPAIAGLTDEEIIELRKQERSNRSNRSSQELATRFVAGRN